MFLINIFDLVAVVFGLCFAFPWALILLPNKRSGLVLMLTTIAISLGSLSLWMMVLTLIHALSLPAIVGGVLALLGFGAAYLFKTQKVYSGGSIKISRRVAGSIRQNPLAAGVIMIILGLAALILFNAIYWPFADDDATSIYAYYSRQIYEHGRLPKGEGLYEAYPMLLPLNYVYTYLAAGEINEYLARIMGVTMGLGALGATAALARALYDHRTGIGAALLLALAPGFARWASAGYTDIPAGFFLTLAALFAWRLSEEPNERDAILMGVMAGFAAWTKNSTLTLVVSVPAWLIYARWRGAAITRWQIALALGSLALVAGPWYLRNQIVFGRVVADTVWTDRAEHTIVNLVPFADHFDQFGFVGPLLMASVALVLVELLLRDRRAALLAIFAVPFAGAWWWMASYEVRFLFTILPLVTVAGSHMVIRLWDASKGERKLHPTIQIALVVILLALALPSVRKAVVFKGEIARDPFMGNAERHRIRLGAIYDVATYMNELAAGGNILSSNYYLPFHSNAPVVVGGLPDREHLVRYDYLIMSPSHALPTFIDPAHDVERLTSINGYTVYRVIGH